MSHGLINTNWEKSAGELVFAWNPQGDADALPEDATRTSRFPEECLVLFDQTVEPRAEGFDAVDEAAGGVSLDYFLRLDPFGSSAPGVLNNRETRDGPRSLPHGGAAIPFPRIGQYFAGFMIRGELGRGTFGRVYLAEQSGLANRCVALKVSRLLGEEPRNLARLQHTHIVPIHSVHDDPITGLRLLCMPYVGGANLARVLEQLGPGSPTVGSGRSFLQALDRLA